MVYISKFKEYGILLLSIFIFSYTLNFIWESLHSVFLYEGHNIDAIRYILMISHASSTDGLLVIGIYIIVSLFWKSLLWIRNIDKKQIYVFIAAGLIIAAFIEYRAVFLVHRWNYNSFMPTIFGIGVSPLIQLSITGILALFLTKELFYGKGIYYGR